MDANVDIKNNVEETIDDTIVKFHRQSLLLGGQSACKLILDKIIAFEHKPGSKSNNDHKRLIKDIKNFCEIGLSRKVNTEEETEPG